MRQIILGRSQIWKERGNHAGLPRWKTREEVAGKTAILRDSFLSDAQN
jgi:hypothetical protein